MIYYNDNYPKACAWLRELIREGELPNGDVDERSICDVEPGTLRQYDQCHFFAGIGGWPLALRWAGYENVPGIWTGSCPCQPLSCAGKRQGHADERHLWPAFHRLISECRPATIFGEQVASKDGREWFAGVRLDLEDLGYACGAADLCAAGVGAPHMRQRLYWVADSETSQWGAVPTHISRRRYAQTGGPGGWSNSDLIPCRDGKSRRVESGTFPLAHGVPCRVGLLRGYGNAIVPQVAQVFIEEALT